MTTSAKLGTNSEDSGEAVVQTGTQGIEGVIVTCTTSITATDRTETTNMEIAERTYETLRGIGKKKL